MEGHLLVARAAVGLRLHRVGRLAEQQPHQLGVDRAAAGGGRRARAREREARERAEALLRSGGNQWGHQPVIKREP